MGAATESVSLEKNADTHARDAAGGPGAVASEGPAFDSFVEGLFQGSPAEPPDTAAGAVSVQRLKAPVLQRAQRLYGNRASQQIIMRAHVLQRKCDCGGTCPKCQKEEEQRAVQRNPSTSGAPLEAVSRAESANSLDALAYTSGRDTYFAAGMYAPASTSGQRLLAQEAAHVVQRSPGKEPAIARKSAGAKMGAPDHPLETEAGQPEQELTDEEQRKRQSSIQRSVARLDRGPLVLQTKLAINEPGDAYEREADSVADRLTQSDAQPLPVEEISRMPSNGVPKPVNCQSSESPASGLDAGMEARIQSPVGGRPIPPAFRQEMEAGLGTDLSHVLVHDGTSDRADADRLNAKAFTHGSHIWIGSGDSADDRRLMAHELTHVVQQTGAVQRKAVDGAATGAGGSATALAESPEPEPPLYPAAAAAPGAPPAGSPPPAAPTRGFQSTDPANPAFGIRGIARGRSATRGSLLRRSRKKSRFASRGRTSWPDASPTRTSGNSNPGSSSFCPSRGFNSSRPAANSNLGGSLHPARLR